MWDQLMGKSNGCILAHCMGLGKRPAKEGDDQGTYRVLCVGKTLQVVVVVTTLFIEIEKGNKDIPSDVYVSVQRGPAWCAYFYTIMVE